MHAGLWTAPARARPCSIPTVSLLCLVTQDLQVTCRLGCMGQALRHQAFSLLWLKP